MRKLIIRLEGLLTCREDLIQDMIKIMDIVGSQYKIDMREVFEKRVLFCIGHAACDSDQWHCAGALIPKPNFPITFLSAKSRIEQVLKIRRSALRFIFDPRQSPLLQLTHHDLGVELIHLAAICSDKKVFNCFIIFPLKEAILKE